LQKSTRDAVSGVRAGQEIDVPCPAMLMSQVLVVDDDLDSGDGLARMLRKRGHHAMAVPNGRDALALLMSMTPDAIVLDMRMPSMDGAMFLDVVRSYLRLQNVPVLLFTAYPDGPEVARAQKLGVRGVYCKGADFKPILNAIDEAVESSRAAAMQISGSQSSGTSMRHPGAGN
jgi:CheY-like chemotaxis protein